MSFIRGTSSQSTHTREKFKLFPIASVTSFLSRISFCCGSVSKMETTVVEPSETDSVGSSALSSPKSDSFPPSDASDGEQEDDVLNLKVLYNLLLGEVSSYLCVHSLKTIEKDDFLIEEIKLTMNFAALASMFEDFHDIKDLTDIKDSTVTLNIPNFKTSQHSLASSRRLVSSAPPPERAAP